MECQNNSTRGVIQAVILLVASLGTGCSDQGDPGSTTTATTTAPATQPPAQAGSKGPDLAFPSGPGTANYTTEGPIKAEPPAINAGLVEPGSTVKGDFKLLNTSGQPVTVLAARPSCTCTTLELDGKTIPARSSINVPVEMKVSSATGTKQAAVNIVFKGLNQIVQITLTAQVAYKIKGTPTPYIDAVAPENVTGTFGLQSIDGRPFNVVSVMGQKPVFVGFNPGSDAPRNNYTLRYDLRSYPCNAMPMYAIIETDHPECRILDMRIRHECTRFKPQLSLGQFVANAGVIPVGGRGEFMMEIKNLGNAGVSGVSTSTPEVAVRLVDQVSDGTNVQCTVEVVPRQGVSGVLYFPVTFHAAGRSAPVQVYCLVE